MLLVGVALTFLLLFATLHALVIPRLERMCREDVESSLVRRTARLYVAYLGRSMSAVALIVTTFALSLMAVLMLLPIEDAATSAALIRRLAAVRQQLSTISPITFALIAVFSTVLLVLTVRATTRRRVAQLFETSMRDVLEQLARERSTGIWVELSPTPEMVAVDQALNETAHLAVVNDGAEIPDEVRQARLRELERRRDELMAVRERLDVKRRVSDDLDIGRVVAPVVPGFMSALRPPWFRPGALRQITAKRRAALTVGLVLAFLGTAGALTPVGTEVLDERLTALDESAITAAERYSLSRMYPDDIRTTRGPRSAILEEEAKLRSARAFELAFGQFLLEQSDNVGTSALTREQVLIEFATTRRSDNEVSALAALEEATVGPERAAVDWVVRRAEAGEPITLLGQRFAKDTEALAKRYPVVLDRVLANPDNELDHATGRPPITALRALLASEAVGQVLARAPADARSPVAGVARELSDSIGVDALEPVYALKARQFNTALADTASIDGAGARAAWTSLDRMRRPVYLPLTSTLERLPSIDPTRPPASLAPPALRAAPSREVDTFRARGVLTNLRGVLGYRGDDAGSWLITAPLSEYDDWFPAQYGSEARTERGRLLTEWGTNVADLGLFSRSRSAPRLSDAARGAGLSIGQPPLTARTTLDLRDIQWTAHLQLLELNVVDAQGTITALGAFSRATIAAALAYAADARPMALAVSSGAPLPGRRAIFHPALVNTPLGCRMQLLVERLDTFVRTKVVDPQYDAFAELYAAYSIAWALRARLVDQVARYEGSQPAHPSWVRDEAEMRLLDPDLGAAVGRALSRGGALAKSDKSLFRQMPEYFDPWLVEVLEECAASPDRLELDTCVTGSVRRWAEHRAPTAELAWWQPPPDVDLSLYAADAPYTLDPALTALRMPADGDFAGLMKLLDVRVSASMTSPAAHKSNADPRKGGLDEDAAFGRAIWPLPALGERTSRALLRTIADSPERRALVESLAQFIVLQRVFRLAFEGRLGPRFKLDRLTALSRLTARAPVQRTRTWRWYDRAGSLEREFAETIDAAEAALDRAAHNSSRPGWLSDGRRRIAACADEVRRRDAAGDNLSEISDDRWSRSCVFGAPPVVDRGVWAPSEAILRALARRAATVRELRRLRRALGVHNDDHRVVNASSCPPL